MHADNIVSSGSPHNNVLHFSSIITVSTLVSYSAPPMRVRRRGWVQDYSTEVCDNPKCQLVPRPHPVNVPHIKWEWPGYEVGSYNNITFAIYILLLLWYVRHPRAAIEIVQEYAIYSNTTYRPHEKHLRLARGCRVGQSPVQYS